MVYIYTYVILSFFTVGFSTAQCAVKLLNKILKQMDVKSNSINEQYSSSIQMEKQCVNNITNAILKHQDFTSLFEESDHSINKVHISEIPKICKNEPCMLGVDEAGRGPVLGPMVYGIAYIPLSKKQILVDIGCADSKSLSEEERDTIFDKICANHQDIGWSIEAISPNFISNSMYKRCKSSLNEVSMNSAIGLIKRALEDGVNVTEIYVDTVGKSDKYELKLKAIFPQITKIVVAKKADSTYPVVSAASICAKVSRDHALKAWKFRETQSQREYGSGYPMDPITKQWLTDNVDPIFGFPQIVRFSWSTAEKILETESEEVAWQNPELDAMPKKQKISNFFTAISSEGIIKRKKHEFFDKRSMTNTISF